METNNSNGILYQDETGQQPLVYDDFLKAKDLFDKLPKPPRIEIWISTFYPSGVFYKIPAVQNGEDISYTKKIDEIWLVNQDDFGTLDILERDISVPNILMSIPVFRPGGIRIR